jgi:hypothetical protein
MSQKQLYLIQNEHYCLVGCGAMQAGGNTNISEEHTASIFREAACSCKILISFSQL